MAIEKINDYAFSYEGITSITLPENLKEIGNNAFISNNLTNITIPKNVEKIGIDALKKNNNSNAGLVNIVNKTNKEFYWGTITNSTIKPQYFSTGIINHTSGNINVTN